MARAGLPEAGVFNFLQALLNCKPKPLLPDRHPGAFSSRDDGESAPLRPSIYVCATPLLCEPVNRSHERHCRIALRCRDRRSEVQPVAMCLQWCDLLKFEISRA